MGSLCYISSFLVSVFLRYTVLITLMECELICLHYRNSETRALRMTCSLQFHFLQYNSLLKHSAIIQVLINHSPIILPNVDLYLIVHKFHLTLLELSILKDKNALIWRHWKPSRTKISCPAKYVSISKLFHTGSLLHYHAAWDLAGSTGLFCTSDSCWTVSVLCTV